MQYIPTDDNVADIFTKALPKAKFKHFIELLGLRKLEMEMETVVGKKKGR